MVSNQTTLLERHIQQTWLSGYQRAVDAMREWAEDFADDQYKAAILECATMVEFAKPTREMLGG
jgi:hypothetical protein